MIAAVLWYRPAARFSKSEATITTPSSLARACILSVAGPPGIALRQLEIFMVLNLAKIHRR